LGHIVEATVSIFNLIIITKGEKHISGLTDTTVLCHLRPKNAGRIHTRFSLSKNDDAEAQVVEHLPGMCKALSSNPGNIHTHKDDVCQNVVRKSINKQR
jgi:hypothetical protein